MVTITKAIGVFFIWILVLHLLCAAEKVSSSRIFFGNTFCSFRDSLVAQMVKRLPAMRETQIWSLGQEDPVEKEMATHSSILAWRIPQIEGPGGLQSVGSHKIRHDWACRITAGLAETQTLGFHPQNLWCSGFCIGLENLYSWQVPRWCWS